MTKLLAELPDNIQITHTENGAVLTFTVVQSCPYFEGHFPQASILPGVTQLDWAVKLAKQYLSLHEREVENVEVLKYQVVITPDTELTLTLNQKNENKVTFKYTSDKGVHASGRIVFEAQ